MKEKFQFLNVEGSEIKISNPNKVLFPKIHMTKWEYVLAVSRLAPYLLPYCKDRLLTTIRFPDGPVGKSFYQKNAPQKRPEWVQTFQVKDTEYVLLNNIQTLVWLSNLACLEFHISFNLISSDDYPTELVFDIDPSVTDFKKVIEVALETKKVLDQLNLKAFIKTSGASGLQVYVPILQRYTYEKTRKVTEFIARYLREKRPDIITLKRKVKNRGDKVYFDYLQHWRNKTLIAAYSPRGTQEATVSCPLRWEELLGGHVTPTLFTLRTIFTRLDSMGDLFKPLLVEKHQSSLDSVLSFIETEDIM